MNLIENRIRALSILGLGIIFVFRASFMINDDNKESIQYGTAEDIPANTASCVGTAAFSFNSKDQIVAIDNSTGTKYIASPSGNISTESLTDTSQLSLDFNNTQTGKQYIVGGGALTITTNLQTQTAECDQK